MKILVLYFAIPCLVAIPLLLAVALFSEYIGNHYDRVWGGAILGYYLAYHFRLARFLVDKLNDRVIERFGWS